MFFINPVFYVASSILSTSLVDAASVIPKSSQFTLYFIHGRLTIVQCCKPNISLRQVCRSLSQQYDTTIVNSFCHESSHVFSSDYSFCHLHRASKTAGIPLCTIFVFLSRLLALSVSDFYYSTATSSGCNTKPLVLLNITFSSFSHHFHPHTQQIRRPKVCDHFK